MNNNDSINEVAKNLQTLENAPLDYEALEWDYDLEDRPAMPVWAGRAAWRLDFEEDLEDILGERYRDYNIRGLVKAMREEMTRVGNYYLEPYEAGDYWFDSLLYHYNYGADWLRWLEQQDVSGTLENEGLIVCEGWANRWHWEHSIKAIDTDEGEEITLDFHSLEIERDGERREVWAWDYGDGMVVFLDSAEAVESMEEMGYNLLEPLIGWMVQG